MSKKAIINFAAGKWYPEGQRRMKASFVKQGFDGEFLLFRDAYPPGCPTHADSPYAFKPYCFKYAFDQGFDEVWWVDSSMVAIRPLTKYTDWVAEQGHYLGVQGHLAGTWCSDKTMNNFGVTRDWLFNINDVNANFIILTKEKCQAFLDRWIDASKDGSFVGDWNNFGGTVSSDPRVRGHRHDQVCAAIIAKQYGMTVHKFAEHWQKEYEGEVTFPENYVLTCKRCMDENDVSYI